MNNKNKNVSLTIRVRPQVVKDIDVISGLFQCNRSETVTKLVGALMHINVDDAAKVFRITEIINHFNGVINHCKELQNFLDEVGGDLPEAYE
jgi:hypothetical protein